METPLITHADTQPLTPSQTASGDKHSLDTDHDPNAKRVKLDIEDLNGTSAQAEPSGSTCSNTLSLPEITKSTQGKNNSGKKKKGNGEDHATNNKSGGKKDGKEWVGRRRGTRVDNGDTDAAESKAPRLPKRLCALLIGFCGSGFSGMQIQPNTRTIEGTLFSALVAAGAVSADNADDPVKVNLQRAARTDAGVHAAGNVVSLKMITSIPDVPDLISRINEELPPEIRLWSFQRVQNSFNARLSCDSRRYTYYFPSYMLIPPKPNSAFARAFTQQSQDNSSTDPVSPFSSHPFWSGRSLASTRAEDMVRKKAWRVGSEQMNQLRATAKKFEGTHNFYNFTVGRNMKDRSSMRHMKLIEVADPVVHGDTEWISVMLHGQSFMLHQIRKMMCILVIAVRTGTPASLIDALYGKQAVTIPKMPSLGLLLEHPIFESYSKRIATANEKLDPSHPDYRYPIDFDSHKSEIEKFKEEHIYRRMRESEEKVEVFDRWLSLFDRYTGSDLLYFNPLGNIPPEAVQVKGQRHVNPFRERKRFDATEFAADASVAAEEAKDVAEETIPPAETDDLDDEEKLDKKSLEEAEG